MDDEKRRVSRHEAGHCVVAAACGWELGPVTTTGGTALAGCCRYSAPLVPGDLITGLDACSPFLLWPGGLRRRFEADVLINLGGGLAELMLSDPVTGRVPDPACERVTERVAELAATLPPPDEADRAWAVSAVNAPEHETDDERIARTVWAAFGRDLASAAGFLMYAEAQARALILAQASKIERLADVLGHAGMLSGQAAAELVREPGDAAA